MGDRNITAEKRQASVTLPDPATKESTAAGRLPFRKEQSMADKESRPRAITADSVAAWNGSADDAHLIGQALLDALERRKGKLDRRMLQADDSPQRILKLMD